MYPVVENDIKNVLSSIGSMKKFKFNNYFNKKVVSSF
jgi:hypothetical protein